MKPIDFLILLLSFVFVIIGFGEFSYFKKGWGMNVHIAPDPYDAGEKPFPSKIERIYLFIQGAISLIVGAGLFYIVVNGVLNR